MTKERVFVSTHSKVNKTSLRYELIKTIGTSMTKLGIESFFGSPENIKVSKYNPCAKNYVLHHH